MHCSNCMVMEFLQWAMGKRTYPNAPGVTLGDAIEKLTIAKTASNRRPSYIKSLNQYLRHFAKNREHLPISSITTDQIRAWYDSRNESPATKISTIGKFNSLFSHAIREGWIEKNPIDRIELPRAERPVPFVLRLDQVRMLLDRARNGMTREFPVLVIALFCGLRPVECQELVASEIDLTGRWVIVNAEKSKTRARRKCPISENAARMLDGFSLDHLPMHRTGWRKMTDSLCRVLGISKWPHDALRHTAASFLLAREQDASRVSLWLGNSPAVLLRHYVEPLPKPEVDEFWSL